MPQVRDSFAQCAIAHRPAAEFTRGALYRLTSLHQFSSYPLQDANVEKIKLIFVTEICEVYSRSPLEGGSVVNAL